MGTRADFYIGRGESAEWLGSIAWDGNPFGLTPRLAETEPQPWGGVVHKDADWPKGEGLLDATTEAQYRERLARFFMYREDVTLPDMGWPWPWEDSRTTDYAYAFDGGVVYASCFGHEWFVATQEPTDEDEQEKYFEGAKTAVFPTMDKKRFAAPGTNRSGVMVFTAPVEP